MAEGDVTGGDCLQLNTLDAFNLLSEIGKMIIAIKQKIKS